MPSSHALLAALRPTVMFVVGITGSPQAKFELTLAHACGLGSRRVRHHLCHLQDVCENCAPSSQAAPFRFAKPSALGLADAQARHISHALFAACGVPTKFPRCSFRSETPSTVVQARFLLQLADACGVSG